MKFLPGQSGNAAGRPPGALNKKTLALEAAYEDRAEEVVRNIMERAKNGDPAAMRLCMERAAPTGRNRRLAFRLPRITTPEDAELAIEVVMNGLAEGMLTLAEVSTFLNLVERLLGLAEVVDRKKHIRAVMQAHRNTAAEADEPAADEAVTAESNLDTDPEADGDDGPPLYFPVNHGAEGPGDLISSQRRAAAPPPYASGGATAPESAAA
jgi:hypothetical protein